MSSGKRRRLEAVSDSRGIIAALAIDQRDALRSLFSTELKIEKRSVPREQLEQFKEVGKQVGPEEIRAVEEAWSALMGEVRANHHLDPASPEAQDLARRLVELRRTEVEPKREMLERLRARHEETRRQWERGHELLYSQLVEARAALQAKTISQEEYCRVREAYMQALRLYQQGIQRYRAGMDFYARALDAYGERFLVPYTQGFSDRQRWEALIRQLEQGDLSRRI